MDGPKGLNWTGRIKVDGHVHWPCMKLHSLNDRFKVDGLNRINRMVLRQETGRSYKIKLDGPRLQLSGRLKSANTLGKLLRQRLKLSSPISLGIHL